MSQRPAQAEPVLELRGISKEYPGVRALNGVSFALHAGEILGVLGENGAGKSTLIRVIGGVVRPDAGELYVDGRLVQFNIPQDATRCGISVIHQELEVIPALSVTENLLLGNLPAVRPGIVDWAEAHVRASGLLKMTQVDVDPRRLVGSLTMAERQLVVITRALGIRARILVMDEPTSALGETEVESLHRLIERARAEGAAVVYISHRLAEVIRLAHRITVLRDGRQTLTINTSEGSVATFVRAMVGRDIDESLHRRQAISLGEPLLEVRDLQRKGSFDPLSFVVRSGEIVALYGLLGAGCTAVTRAIVGSPPASSGAVYVAGHLVNIRSPIDARRARVGLVPEDRRQGGLILPSDVATNIVLASFSRYVRLGLVLAGLIRTVAAQWVRQLAVRTVSVTTPVSTLSGGNQQKVILARWLDAGSRVLILEEPTRGIDVGAKREIYRLMTDLAVQGVAILLVSSEIPEILALADRILVMSRGRVTQEFSQRTATRELLIANAAS